jgi:hypothetical protein
MKSFLQILRAHLANLTRGFAFGSILDCFKQNDQRGEAEASLQHINTDSEFVGGYHELQIPFGGRITPPLEFLNREVGPEHN